MPSKLEGALARLAAVEETVKLQGLFVNSVATALRESNRRIESGKPGSECEGDSCEHPQGTPRVIIVFERAIQASFADWLQGELLRQVEVMSAADAKKKNVIRPKDIVIYVHRWISNKLDGFVDKDLLETVTSASGMGASVFLCQSYSDHLSCRWKRYFYCFENCFCVCSPCIHSLRVRA